MKSPPPLPPEHMKTSFVSALVSQSTSDNTHTAAMVTTTMMRVTLLLCGVTSTAILAARVQTVKREAEDPWGLTKARVPQVLHRYCDQSTIFSEGLMSTGTFSL